MSMEELGFFAANNSLLLPNVDVDPPRSEYLLAGVAYEDAAVVIVPRELWPLLLLRMLPPANFFGDRLCMLAIASLCMVPIEE